MNKEIKVKISLEELPDQPNYQLAVVLESEINDAVARALNEAFDDGVRGKEWAVHVPSF